MVKYGVEGSIVENVRVKLTSQAERDAKRWFAVAEVRHRRTDILATVSW